ncbi:MAG: hypothetical protein NVSMB57_01350 [Actinomycetota bacterium]
MPLFAGSADKDLIAIAGLLDEARCEAGEAVLREGDAGRQAFILIEGVATVTVHGHPVARLGPGEFIGEMALLDLAPRSATVTAVTPLRLLVADPRNFERLAAYPAIARAISRALARRLRLAEGATSSYRTPAP